MKPPEVTWVRVAPGGWHIKKTEEERTMDIEDMIVTRKVDIMECGAVIKPTDMSSMMWAKPSDWDKYCPDCNVATICEW